MEVLSIIGIGYLVVAFLLLVSIYIKAYRTKTALPIHTPIVTALIWPLWIVIYFNVKNTE